MKSITIVFILFSSALMAQSITVDSIGLNEQGKTIIQVTQTDTLPDNTIRIHINRITKAEYRNRNREKIDLINEEIQALQIQIQKLKARKAELKRVNDL